MDRLLYSLLKLLINVIYFYSNACASKVGANLTDSCCLVDRLDIGPILLSIVQMMTFGFLFSSQIDD